MKFQEAAAIRAEELGYRKLASQCTHEKPFFKKEAAWRNYCRPTAIWNPFLDGDVVEDASK